MKLSTRARYAMHLRLEVARRPAGATSLREVAERTRISRRYLDQLVIGLRHANLVQGQSGHGGGYRLTRSPREISIGEVIEAAIGPINVVDCVRHPETCLKADLCECRIVHALLNDRILELLHGISLADMASKEWLRCAERELLRRMDGRLACNEPSSAAGKRDRRAS